MIEVIKVLVSFGFDFEYENYGSQGEKIISFSLGVEVVNQDGFIYYDCGSDSEKLESNDKHFKYIASLVEQECITETSSF